MGRGGGGGATAKNSREVMCLWPSLIQSGRGGGTQKVYTYLMNSNRNKEMPEDKLITKMFF